MCGHEFLLPQDKYQEMLLVDCMAILCLVFHKTAKLFIKVVAPFYILTRNV